MENDFKALVTKIYEKVQSPITFFDIESTGLDKISDDIIQLYLCRYDGTNFIESSSYYNTTTKIRKEAFEKHGITEESLKDYPYFSECALPLFNEFFPKGTIICGFNSNKFDIPFIVEKFLQNNITGAVHLLNHKRLDVYDLYKKIYPNTLDAIYERMVSIPTGKPMSKDFHDAKNDVVATVEILDKLMEEADFDICTMPDVIDSDGFFKREDSSLLFAKGKYKDMDIMKMNTKDSLGFLNWLTKNDGISIHTKAIANKIISKIEGSLLD